MHRILKHVILIWEETISAVLLLIEAPVNHFRIIIEKIQKCVTIHYTLYDKLDKPIQRSVLQHKLDGNKCDAGEILLRQW